MCFASGSAQHVLEDTPKRVIAGVSVLAVVGVGGVFRAGRAIAGGFGISIHFVLEYCPG